MEKYHQFEIAMFDSMLFSGTTEVSLDDKGRLSMPVRYRKLLKDDEQEKLVITVSLFEKCLWVYLTSEWDRVAEVLNTLPTLRDPVYRTVMRRFIGNAVVCDIDKQGRVLIPQELRDEAGLSKKAFLVGINNKFELWSQENLEKQQEIDEQLLKDSMKTLSSQPLFDGLRL